MVTNESKPKARTTKTTAAAKAPEVKVTRSTPIKVVKRDESPRTLGIAILGRFYMGEMDLDLVKRRALRYEGRQLGDEEAVLSLLTDMIRNADDNQLKSKLMEAVAEYLSILGQDPRRVLAEMHKTELKIFKDLGFTSVSITCKDGACAACRKVDGTVVTIERALVAMPLPHATCTRKVHSKAAPFCRCRYFGEYTG